RFNARLVAHAFKQWSGVDYFSIYIRLVLISLVSLVLSYIAVYDYNIYQLDMRFAIL
ncbi:hypothetical protein L873DRAFT_1712375, partial [Choiromyces venosus 120613-1]